MKCVFRANRSFYRNWWNYDSKESKYRIIVTPPFPISPFSVKLGLSWSMNVMHPCSSLKNSLGSYSQKGRII